MVVKGEKIMKMILLLVCFVGFVYLVVVMFIVVCIEVFGSGELLFYLLGFVILGEVWDDIVS